MDRVRCRSLTGLVQDVFKAGVFAGLNNSVEQETAQAERPQADKDGCHDLTRVVEMRVGQAGERHADEAGTAQGIIEFFRSQCRGRRPGQPLDCKIENERPDQRRAGHAQAAYYEGWHDSCY